MNNVKSVSVVVPVYNAESYIAECLESILAQSYKDFELILVDDGSKDSSGRICDDYALRDSRIRVIHQQNGGVTAARRHGVQEAQGEWISFVDADDKLEAEGLEKLVAVAEQDNELDIIEGAYTWFYPDGTTKVRKNMAHENGPTYFDPQKYSLSLSIYIGPARGPWAKLIRKNLLINSGALELPRKFTNREDAMMLTTAARQMRKAVLLSVPVYLYRNQFGVTAVSNKLSLEYWTDYLNYTENVVLKGLLPQWNNVWYITVKDVFGIIVHSGCIKSGRIPVYFEESVLPVLKAQKTELHSVDRLYVSVFSLCSLLRYPACMVLYAFYTLKKRLLGKYFALKSRK